MITELLLTGLFGVADFMLGLLPPIEWTVDTSAWEFGRDALSMICWLLPMNTIRALIGVIITLALFRILISVILFFVRFIPGL